MLALTLLVASAAAGVNAMIGKEIHAVEIPENNTYFCAEECAHENIYFSRSHAVCRQSELLSQVDKNGNLDPEYPYACAGEKPLPNLSLRLMQEGDHEDVYKCDLLDLTLVHENKQGLKNHSCAFFRQGGSSGLDNFPIKVEEEATWSEIKARLDATPQLTDLSGFVTPDVDCKKKKKPSGPIPEPGTDNNSNQDGIVFRDD